MKRLLILTMVAIISAATVLLGGLASADKTRYNNDFVRLFPPHAADVNTIFRISRPRINLAGLSGKIYLSDREGIFIVEPRGDTARIDLTVPFGYSIDVDSPYFFVHNGSSGLKRGDIRTRKIDTVFHDFPSFTAIQMISADKAIIQTMDISKRQNLLKKPFSSRKHILRKQIDGPLCTDGLLKFSKDLNQLIYIYRYRNQFIYLDTALNVVKYGKTIDTTSVAKIAVSEVDGKITMSKPPLAVNNDACVDGKYLFVQSNLMARNESQSRAKGKSVVDVYNLVDGSYRFSFYIENYDGSKMQEFKVKGSRLVVLFKQAVVTYDLPKRYLP